MKTVAIIQARMGSTRLPGKVLMPLGGHPVLEWSVRACDAAPGVDEVWVATSLLPADDEIVDFCRRRGINWFRGSETDVLSRFLGCAEAADASIAIRITGDCPFHDPEIIGAVVALMKRTGASFASNCSPRTYPDGLDLEAARFAALAWADTFATRPIDRDCVMQIIERNRDRFPAETLINPIPDMAQERWVLDTEADYRFCQEIALRHPWDHGPPSMLNIMGILDLEPELRMINRHHPCNERFYDALAEEPLYERTFERSQKQFERAKAVIPLGAQTFSKSHLQYPQPSPLFLSHAQGGEAWDVDGNSYVDLVSALLPNILGYRDPDVDTAIRRQVASGISFSLATRLESELAEILCRLIPCAEAVRFGKTGTDVTTAAIRLARAFTGRDRVLICGGYHGWADWSVERNKGVPEDIRRLTERIPFGNQMSATEKFGRQTVKVDPSMSYSDMLAVEARLKKDWIAAIIVEPEGDPEYLEHLRYLCDHYGSVLIFDEVITGFRFDLGGAQKLYGVTPDLATFGKAMANGMPISAVVGKKSIMKLMEPPDNIFYSGTFFGETLSLAAAIATIKKLEREDVIPKLWTAGLGLSDRVETMLANHGIDAFISLSGKPPLKRLKFANDDIAALFRMEMIKTGVLINASHNLCFAHGPNEIMRIRKSYDHALGEISKALAKGDIKERLNGAAVAKGVR